LGYEAERSIMAKVRINQAGVRDLYQQIADRIEGADQQFRSLWTGKPVAEIEPNVASTFGEIGVTLPADTVRSYAEAVSAGEDFVWKLK
jgi:hypothetical protein